MSHERRRHPRFEVKGITGTWDGHMPLKVRVLGLGGMLVETRTELSPGDVGDVKVDLPGEGPFRSAGRVLYLGPTSGGAYRIGMAFESLSVKERVTLESFLTRRPESQI
jgi:hypothetical protein